MSDIVERRDPIGDDPAEQLRWLLTGSGTNHAYLRNAIAEIERGVVPGEWWKAAYEAEKALADDLAAVLRAARSALDDAYSGFPGSHLGGKIADVLARHAEAVRRR